MSDRMLRPFCAVIAICLAVLACSMPGASAPSAVPLDATKIALEILATKNAPVPTQVVDATKIALEIQATNNAPAVIPVVDATKVALEVQATNAAAQLTQQAGQQAQPAQAVAQEGQGQQLVEGRRRAV